MAWRVWAANPSTDAIEIHAMCAPARMLHLPSLAIGRQPDAHVTPASARPGGNFARAAGPLADRARDRPAESAAVCGLRPGRRTAVEAIEHARPLVRLDADARVDHLDDRGPGAGHIRSAHSHIDVSAR